MADLSKAQVVLRDFWDARATISRNIQLASAFEALADQVVPEHKPWHRTGGEPAARHKVRLEILAIAAELRGQDQPSSEEP